MVEHVTVQKSYEIEYFDDHVVLHFKPHVVLGSKKNGLLLTLFVVGIFGGWLPALGVGFALGGGEYINLLGFFAGWFGPLFIVIRMMIKNAEHFNRRGTTSSTVLLYPDKIRTAATNPKSYDRSEISGVFSLSPDTTFTYRNYEGYNAGKAISALKGKRAYSVGIQYGDDKFPIIGTCLKELQASEIRDLITEWASNPASILQENKLTA